MNKFCMVVALSTCCIAAYSQFSLELNAGAQRVSAHVKVFKYIDQRHRWSIYSGNQAAVKYEKGNPTISSANILAYNFKNGIGIGAVLIAGKNGLHPSAGLQYQKTIKLFYVYFLSTYELNKVAKQENYFILVYKHKLSNKVKFVFHNENYFSFRKWDYDQSFQRIKAGLEIRQTQFGLISETSQTGKGYQTKVVNLGGYIKQSF